MVAIVLKFRKATLTSLQVSNLRSLGGSAIDAGALDAGGLAIFIRHLLDLLGKLPGRSQNQTLGRDRTKYKTTRGCSDCGTPRFILVV